MKASLGSQLRLLARRSVVRTFRDPGSIAPAIVVPLVLFIVISAGLEKATKVPGFPTDVIWTFTLTIAFANGAMIAVANAGQAIATDIEEGFINRLALTPMRATALLGSQLAGPVVLGFLQAAAFLAVGLAFGARFEAGPLGAAVLVLLFLTSIIAFGSLGMFIGLRTGSGQAVQAIAPVLTVFLFLSSVNFPRNLIKADWFRAVATANPLSYEVEGMRSVLVTGWDAEALALGFGTVVAIAVITLAAASMSLQGRLVRT